MTTLDQHYSRVCGTCKLPYCNICHIPCGCETITPSDGVARQVTETTVVNGVTFLRVRR